MYLKEHEMNESLFLYNYAKHYLQYNVKTVLMRENWDDKDCDAKYAKYMQEYIRIKKEFDEKNIPDARITAFLEGFKRDRLNSTYNDLFNKMLVGLEKRKGNFSPEKKEALRTRLDKHRALADANFEFLFELRKIEEEEY